MIRYCLIIYFALLGTVFSADLQYERAVDISPDRVVRVAHFVRSMQEIGGLSREQNDIDIDIRVDGQVLGAVTKEEGVVHVVLNNSRLADFVPLGDGESLIKLSGVEPRLYSLANALMQPTMEGLRGGEFNWERDSIVISGAEKAGAVASLLGVGIKQSYRGAQTLRRNQVKVVMFDPPSAGDIELMASIHRELGVTNILNFRHCPTLLERLYERLRGNKEVCGVPLQVFFPTKPEERAQVLRTGLRCLGYGLLAYSAYSCYHEVASYLQSLSLPSYPVSHPILQTYCENSTHCWSEDLHFGGSPDYSTPCWSRDPSIANTNYSAIMRMIGRLHHELEEKRSVATCSKAVLSGLLCFLADRLLCRKILLIPDDYVIREAIARAQEILKRPDGIEVLLAPTSAVSAHGLSVG